MCENQKKSLHCVTVPQRYQYVTLIYIQNYEFTIKSVKMGFFESSQLKNHRKSQADIENMGKVRLELPTWKISFNWGNLGVFPIHNLEKPHFY